MQTATSFSIDLYCKELAGKLCRRVQGSDDLGALLAEMTRVAGEAGAPGLAAPQLGVFLQVAIVALAPAGAAAPPRVVLVNPRIVNLGGRDLLETESCLSLPPVEEATARIWRSEIAHVRSGTRENPEADELRIYKGAAARRVQHEIDHLQGIFFIDRCQPVARGIVLRRFEQHLRKQEIERRAEFAARAVLDLAHGQENLVAQ